MKTITRTLLVSSLFSLVLGVLSASPAQAKMSLKFIGDVNIAMGTEFNSSMIGGFSGITYDEKADEFRVLSDNRSEPKIYRFKAKLTETQFEMTALSWDTVYERPGQHFKGHMLDAEGIALAKDGTFYMSTEGKNNWEPRVPPAVMHFDANNVLINYLTIPAKFIPDTKGQFTKGTQNNQAFETLTLSPDQRYLFTATENALLQDDSRADQTKGSLSRILRFDLKTNTTQEYVYPVEALERPQGGGSLYKPGNGLPDMLAIDSTHLISLERGFAEISGNPYQKIKLFNVSLDNATDVSRFFTLRATHGNKAYTPVKKELLMDLDDIVVLLNSNYPKLENFEGLTFGPRVNGKRTLILCADNNFSRKQRTSFFAFAIEE